MKAWNCIILDTLVRATKPKGKLSTTAKKNWLLQANEKKDRDANRWRTVGPNRKIPPKLNLEKIGKLIYRTCSSLTYFENDCEIIIHVFSCLKNSWNPIRSINCWPILVIWNHCAPPAKNSPFFKKGTYKTNCFFSIAYYSGAYIIVDTIY